MTILSRRQFVQQTAAVGLAAAASTTAPLSVRAAERKRKFTMDLMCGAIGVRADQREAIRLAQAHGFESIGPASQYLSGLSDVESAELATELQEKGLVWGAASLPVDFRGSEEKFRAGMREFPKHLAALQRSGVTRVSTWLRPSHSELTYVANFRIHARRLREVSQAAADYGLRFGMEYVGPKTSWSSGRYPFIHTMAEAKDLIAEIGLDNVGLVLDSWHWYTAGDTVADLLSLDNADVVACDLNDAPAGIPVDQQVDNTRELPAATGVIDVKSFLGALVQIGYDGPVRAEPFNKKLNAMENEPAVATTAAALRKAFAFLD